MVYEENRNDPVTITCYNNPMDRGRFRRIFAWVMIGVSVVLYTGALVLSALIPATRLGRHSALWPVDPINLAFLVYGAIGGLVAIRRPHNAVGWIFLAIGFGCQIFALTNAYVAYAQLVGQGMLPVYPSALWLPGVMWLVPFAISPLLLLLFPNGRLISSRWRGFIWVLAAGGVAALLSSGGLMEAGVYSYQIPSLVQQMGLGWLEDPLQTVTMIAFLVVAGAGVTAMALRLSRAKGAERLQLEWFSYAGVLLVAIVLLEGILFNSLKTIDSSWHVPADLFWGIPVALGFVLIPLAAAVAILRYRLYEIDIIIRRTLVYSALTTILALLYFGSVFVLQEVFHRLTGETSNVAVVLSTLLIAMMFTPLRSRVQTYIDRRFYRHKYDAETVLRRFSERSRVEVDLGEISQDLVRVVDETFKPEQVSLWLRKIVK